MEYTIQALSRLAGVTTRTLRWYDEIGLLKAQQGGGQRLPLLRPGGGGPAPGHPVLSGPGGGAGSDPRLPGRPRL